MDEDATQLSENGWNGERIKESRRSQKIFQTINKFLKYGRTTYESSTEDATQLSENGERIKEYLV